MKWGEVDVALPALAIASTSKGGTTAVDTTAHPITMPSGITTDDHIVVCFSCDSNPVVQIDWGSSVGAWRQVGLNRNSTNVSQTIFFAPYTTGLALALTTSTAQQSSFIAHRIPDADYCTMEFSSGDGANSAPAAFTHPSGAQDMLAIVFRSGDSTVVPSVSPTGYSTIDNQAASGTSGASTSSCYKSLTGTASDTPAAFTVATEQWACATVFVCRGTPIPRHDALGAPFPTGVTEPAYLVPYWDALHGVWITKVTDSGASILGTTWRAKSHHEYPSVGAWNCDQSLLYLETAFTDSDRCFLDGSTFAVAHKTTRPASWQTGRWSKSDPLIMYYTTGTAIRTFNVSTGATAATTSDFTGYTDVSFGQNEGDFSDDGLRVALMATRTSDTHIVALICTVTPGSPDTITITTVIDMTALGPVSEGKAAISPDGDLVLLYFGDETQAIYTYLGVEVYTTASEQNPSHSDWTKYNGEQVIVGSDSATGGDIVRRSSVTDTVTEINGNSWCYHTSARNTVNRGFCVSSYSFDSGVPFVNEICAPLLSGTRTYRICHEFRSTDTAYDNESHPTVSPDGKYIVFESDWGNAAAVDVYVASFGHMNLP